MLEKKILDRHHPLPAPPPPPPPPPQKLNGRPLNGRQSSSNKEHNISLRLVLFFPFRCCFAGSPQFSISTVKQTKLFHPTSEMFFTLFTRKNSLRKTFLLECVRSGAQQAARKGGNFGAKLTPLWLLIGRIIFLTCEKTSFAILIGRIIFFTSENHSSLF